LRRSRVKASVRARCEWAKWSHSYLSGEMRVGEMTIPDGCEHRSRLYLGGSTEMWEGPRMCIGLIWVWSSYMGPLPPV
jgi:hypothetical protein